MKITLRTASTLTRFLPADAEGERARLDVPDGATAADVMAQLGFPLDQPYLVTLNGASLPRAEHATRPLAEGDDLAVLPPLRGG